MKRLTAVTVLLLSASAVSGCQTMTGRTAGQHFNDKWVLHETKGRIATQMPRALTAMNVDVNRGTVYLIGTVTTPEQKARAELGALPDPAPQHREGAAQLRRPVEVILGDHPGPGAHRSPRS